MLYIEVHPEISEEQILGEIRKVLKEYPTAKASVLSQGGGFHLIIRISPLEYVRKFYKAIHSLFPAVLKAEAMLEKMGREADITHYPQPTESKYVYESKSR